MVLPQLHVKLERWKYSKEFGIYVSNLGRFRNKSKQLIKPLVAKDSGYMSVQLKYGFGLAHRIVMRTWKPTEDMDHLTVDHLNHNKRDNSVNNLEWVTKKENVERAKTDTVKVNSRIRVSRPFDTACLREFDSYAAAAQWLKENDPAIGHNDSICMATLEKKIEAASKISNVYAAYRWSICGN